MIPLSKAFSSQITKSFLLKLTYHLGILHEQQPLSFCSVFLEPLLLRLAQPAQRWVRAIVVAALGLARRPGSWRLWRGRSWRGGGLCGSKARLPHLQVTLLFDDAVADVPERGEARRARRSRAADLVPARRAKDMALGALPNGPCVFQGR